MGSHAGAEIAIHFAFKIVRNVPPHFYAVDFDGLFRQVLTPIQAYFQPYQMLFANIWNK